MVYPVGPYREAFELLRIQILRLRPLGVAQMDGWTIGRQQALGQSASTYL
jgi:hypothetical protein